MIARCRKVGINCLACTDHNEIEGAFELKRKAPFRIVVGEEVNTGEGEIVGLFLNKWIAPNLGIKNTIEEIKSQDGLVYIPHPLSASRNASLNKDKVIEMSAYVDIIETFNARTRKERNDSAWLDNLLTQGKIVKAAGSDAHYPRELGNVRIEMQEFETNKDFLKSLAEANMHYRKTSKILRIIMNHRTRKIIRKLLWKKQY
jgi:predicted metal-dependent phosphoesterase TrpH